MPLHLQTHIMEPKLRVIINLQHHDHKQSEPFLCHNLYHEYSCHLTPILVNIQQTMANHYFFYGYINQLFLWPEGHTPMLLLTFATWRGQKPNVSTKICLVIRQRKSRPGLKEDGYNMVYLCLTMDNCDE